MVNVLHQHLLSRLGNDTAGLDQVLSYFKAITLKRNEQVLRQGDICRWVYFVLSGCLQVFIVDEFGNETTRDIVIENNWCSELISFGTGQSSNENIRAAEPSKLCAIDRTSFKFLMSSVPQFDKVYKQILEASYANSIYRLNSFVALSALDRIKWLMQHRPELMTRLSSKLIASYLGISGETYSRLKAKL
jgi:CRP-like cAMP-binding protein